jgi:dolichol-phosphate mannosyltransferase
MQSFSLDTKFQVNNAASMISSHHSSTPLSIIMPAYNEEGSIREAVSEIQREVLNKIPGAELLVVNDGSRDRTGAILDEIAASAPEVKVIHKSNGGHGPALRTGLDRAQGDFVFLIDSDRQIAIEDFTPLWDAVQDADAAFGMRITRHDPGLRLILTRIVRMSLTLLFWVRITDANVPFKVVRRSAWKHAEGLIPGDTLAPSLFLAVFLKRNGYKVVERPIHHRERNTGVVSIKRWKLIKFCGRAFKQLLTFRAQLHTNDVRQQQKGSVYVTAP